MKFPIVRSKSKWCITAIKFLASTAIVSTHFSVAVAQDVLPTGAKITAGQAQISAPSASSLLIDQSSVNAIVEWGGFSIGQGNAVHFNNGSGATLNRVTGTGISSINGHLSATGSVFLINQNGIIVGKDGIVQTGGSFVASTLDVTNDDFLDGGDLTFSGPSGATVINLGKVSSLGGDVAFIAHSVVNEGDIDAINGTVGLAAGREILLRDAATDEGKFLVKIGDAKSSVEEKGMIKAANVELRANGGNIYALAGNRNGTITATGVTKRDGRIFLSAGSSGSVSTSKTIRAKRKVVRNAAPKEDGGDVFINAGFASIGGLLDLDGDIGGNIKLETRTLSLAEPVSARGLTEQGGLVDITATGDSLIYTSGLINVSGYTDGGSIRHVTGQTLTHSGTYSAIGETGLGGQIDIGGGATRLLSPTLDASGATGGGTVRVGGEYQGGKGLLIDELPNTLRLAVTDATRISANATGANGDGGRVILWADEKATILGQVSATPGSASGAGGFVELSSGGTLSVLTSGIATGTGTRKGTILLDPKNVTINDVSSVDQSIFILGRGYSYPGVVLEGSDQFGNSVSLDGTRLAVGANGDNGAGNVVSYSGSVYLFSFTDDAFNGGVLEATIGNGYTGGKNLGVSALESADIFGASVSLDGTRLAIGAVGDDGATNAASFSGAVYLFSFTDDAFTGGVLEATIGKAYTSGKDVDVAALGNSDQFGYSVSLDGTRLAVGAFGDDGSGNVGSSNGAVYLFSFTDDAFTGGVLEATLGNGYTSGKNLDVAALENNDFFGVSVSLDGTRIAVGAQLDDGAGNAGSGSGAVYLFSFTDDAFTGGVLEATLGDGYTSGKNIDVAALENNDRFGWSVSLDGTRLAVGALFDDGSGNVESDSGAVYLFSFTDSAFNGVVLEATLGKGYTGGKNVDVSELDNADRFGSDVSLDGTRLAVGARADAGAGNAVSSSGAVYLFSFTDDAFTGGALEATLGDGYTTGKNVDMSALEGNDNFGGSVSLDGTRLAVGARGDDGAGNAVGSSGAVYLFSFADDTFSGGVLEATLGNGYTGGKNLDMAALETGDFFGWSVSLEGSGLAVGALGDDGAGNVAGSSGAVYLFSFTDSAFSGGVLEATLGKDYTGSKDVDVAALESGDSFGITVSLDGTRLAVGAYQDSGEGNVASYIGAVYLFSFIDDAFNGGVLEATLGKGYTGSKNVDVTALENSDNFGSSVSLDGARLAVGARGDDGAGNAVGSSGAVYLFSFADDAFSGGVLEATLGNGYTGGKNVDVAALEGDDSFGWSVSLEGTRLAVGAALDDGAGNAATNSGAVYLFSFTDSDFSGGVLEAILGKDNSGSKNVDVTALTSYTFFGGSVSLDGTRLAVGAHGDDGAGNAATNSGAVYLFSFTDSAFSGGVLESTLGKNYTGAKNIDVSALESNDYFGQSVSLDGTRLAVGAPGDDGVVNTETYSGAVYLFAFSDNAFNGGVLEATIGNGYTGGKNIDVATLGTFDGFGQSISLDGTRLAVGAAGDDGAGTVVDSSGAVYLFSFTDSAFNGGVLEATIGNGYTGSKNMDVAALEAFSYFGYSVSLDGTRLAVGAYGDAGSGNAVNNSGAVYLFSFSDDAFDGGVLEATLGNGYTGSKNVDVAALESDDYFGQSVSLDGNRLAVGAYGDDGAGNVVNNSGAVYLFSFTDSAFTGGVLETTLGKGYTAAKNIDVFAVESNDYFGWSVSLDGTRLAVGARGDDGSGNIGVNIGAVYLFSFTDSAFSGGILEATLGNGYAGGKDMDVATLGTNDYFGQSVSLDGTRLAVGAAFDDGAGDAVSGSGAVYLINNPFGGGSIVSDALYATDPTTSITITPETLTALLSAGNNVVIQANNDITVLAEILANNTSGDGGDLTFKAGRSFIASADITTDNGDLTLIANDLLANGVVDADRDAGTATITLASGVNIDAGTGKITFDLQPGTDKTNTSAGDITLTGNNALTGSAINLLNQGAETDNVITIGAGSILTASGAGDAIVLAADVFNNSAGSSAISLTGGGRYLIYSADWDNDTNGGLTGGNLYNRAYAANLPASISHSGNQFIYERQPTLMITGTDTTVTYNGTTQSLSGYIVAGLVNGDSQAQALTTAAILGSQTNAATYTSGLVSGGASSIGYAISYTQGSLTIDQRALTINASASNKEYDGLTAAVVTLGDDRITGDTLTLANTAATFSDKNVATGKTVTVSGITLGGTDAGNYTFNTTDTTTADITAKALTISASASNKEYDGLTAATVTLGDDRITGDTLTLANTAATFSDKNVATGKTVTVSGITLGGTDAGNYTFNTTDTTTADITAKALTISASASNKEYDGLTVATVTLSDDRITGDALTLGSTATFSDKNVATGKTVTVSGITLGGTDAGNYTFNTTDTTTADITAKALTISASASNKEYDGLTVATVTLSDDGISGDILTLANTAATFSDKNVATGKTVTVSGITLGGTDAGNYTFNTTDTTTADITAKALTISASASNKEYDGLTGATIMLSDDRITGDTLTLANTAATFSDKNVATGKTVTVSGITLGGTDAGNYTFNTTDTTTADITTKALTISASASNKEYDGLTGATITLSDDRITGDTLTLGSTATFSDKNVATGKTVTVSGITLGGTDAGNYTFNTTDTTTADITTKALTISASASNKEYDGLSVATVTLSDDRVTGDTLTLANTAATFSDKNAATGKTVTVSGITLGGTDAGNYTFNTTDTTTADITAKALTISASASNKEYDRLTAATVTLSDDRITGDTLTLANTAATFSDKNVATGKTVTVSGITLGGTDAGNYTFNTTDTTTADITAKALTISASASNKEYDGLTAAVVTLGDDRITGDTLTLANTAATFSDKNVATGKTVTVSGITLGGTDAGNYTFNTTDTTTVDITAKALTITALDDDKIADNAPYSAGAGVAENGFVTGEGLSDLSGTLVYGGTSQGAINTGIYTITVSGLTSSNYQITFGEGILDIQASTPQNLNNFVSASPPEPISVLGATDNIESWQCAVSAIERCKSVDLSQLVGG